MNFEYGRSLSDRVGFLQRNLSSTEIEKNPRLESFINLWLASTGGMFDINEHSDFFRGVNSYSLEQINCVFLKKYGEHIDPLQLRK